MLGSNVTPKIQMEFIGQSSEAYWMFIVSNVVLESDFAGNERHFFGAIHEMIMTEVRLQNMFTKKAGEPHEISNELKTQKRWIQSRWE